MATFAVEGRKWASMNGSHGSHYAHQKLMDEWKQRAVIACRNARCSPVEPPVQITATVQRTTNARADAHNVMPSIKACIDAAVACGVIPDDHDGIVRRLITQAGPKASVPTITLTITEEKP